MVAATATAITTTSTISTASNIKSPQIQLKKDLPSRDGRSQRRKNAPGSLPGLSFKERRYGVKNRIISLVLALALLFSLVSCYKTEKVPPKDRNLTVETEAVEYTAAGIDAVSSRFADLFIRIAPRLGYPALVEGEREAIAEMIRMDIIPIAQNVPIYEEELLELAESAEEYLAVFEEENNSDHDLGFILGLYTRFTVAVDAERLGRFSYRLQLERLREKLYDATENYEKNGYGIEIVEHYEALIEDATALGEGRFTEAFSASVFLFATALGLGDVQGGALSLSTSDALVVIKKQGVKLCSFTLTDSEWQTVAAMCEENIPTGSDTLKSKMLVALNNDNFFVGAATLMPDVIDLYVTLSESFGKESIDMMASGDKLSYMRAILGELMKNEKDLRAFLDKMTAEIPSPERFAELSINAYDKAGYEAFLDLPTADTDALILSVSAFLDSATEESYEALADTFCSFIASKNPVVAYVYFYL